MTPSQFDHRKTLLSRGDAACDSGPERKGVEFVRVMTDVAEGMEALAQATEHAGTDTLERARTWRHAGNAYFDLGASERLRGSTTQHARSRRPRRCSMTAMTQSRD